MLLVTGGILKRRKRKRRKRRKERIKRDLLLFFVFAARPALRWREKKEQQVKHISSCREEDSVHVRATYWEEENHGTPSVQSQFTTQKRRESVRYP